MGDFKYGISYRNLDERLADLGALLDHMTLYREVQRYAREMEKAGKLPDEM